VTANYFFLKIFFLLTNRCVVMPHTKHPPLILAEGVSPGVHYSHYLQKKISTTMPITAQQIASADLQTLQQALLEPSNIADANTMAAINAAIAALNTPPVQAPAAGAIPIVKYAYNSRERIALNALVGDVWEQLTVVAIGDYGVPTAPQAAANMKPVMVQVKGKGQVPTWTAATVFEGASATQEYLTAVVSKYEKNGVKGRSMDVSFGGRKAAPKATLAQLQEAVAIAELETKLFLLENSVVKGGLETAILRKQDAALSQKTAD
jgi:hypothetical protein